MDEGVPKITLGKREFLVPEFTIREQRKLVPLMMRAAAVNPLTAGEAELTVLFDILKVVTARKGASNGAVPLTDEQFEELPVKVLTEVAPAMKVIAQQMGLEAVPAGEGQAGASPPNPTST